MPVSRIARDAWGVSASAIVEIRCNADHWNRGYPEPHSPASAGADRRRQHKIIHALADALAQDQAKALGCNVTVIKSAQDYSEQIRNVYENIIDKPINID